jgi:hypothetical protein
MGTTIKEIIMKIQGLEKFRDYFADSADQYTLIGGAACHLAMDDAGLAFRATKDLDIVLCAEAITPAFVNKLWRFVKEAGYTQQEKGSGERQFYRFACPKHADYPVMLELFSRKPDAVILVGEPHLTPIPMEDEASSLSAILLDDDYYQCINLGKMQVDGISILGAEYILPFKVKAWLDLTQRKEAGKTVDSKNIKKHRNDVFRLSNLLSPAQSVFIPATVARDLKEFVKLMRTEQGLNLSDFGIKLALTDVLVTLNSIYGLINE